jgi:membrane protease subunit (stomatin/prohibitin family)
MGLILAAAKAAKSTLHDQWKEYIKCESLDNNTLMVKKTTENGIITKKSAIEVAPGQVAVIFQNGKILDATAEEGIYTFDESTSPSFFAGQFGDVFKEMWTRFTYGGAVNKDQAIFYINTKEIIDNKFGTPAPVPYQDYSHPIPNQMTNTITPLRVDVKCFGKYTFKISDPAVFMRNIAGTADVYYKEDICEQMRSEVQAAFQKVLNELGNDEHKAPVLELPSKTDEIKEIMDKNVFDTQIRNRGMMITSFLIESVTLDEESNKKIDNYELSSNSFMQQGALVGGFSRGVEAAGSNANGAATGMMGVGMMNMGSNGMMGSAMSNAFNNTDNSKKDLSGEGTPSKFCSNCGKPVSGKFCSNCGTKVE